MKNITDFVNVKKTTQLVVILSIVFCSSVDVHAAMTCKALANINNELYVAGSDGAILSQFALDNRTKSSISFSRNGKKVAYIPDESPETFVIANTNGRIVNILAQKSTQGPLKQVNFDSKDVVKLQYHISPTNDLFVFYHVPENFSSPLRQIVPAIGGVACAGFQNIRFERSCLSEDKLIVNNQVTIDNSALAKKNLSVISSFTALAGTTFSTQSVPSFQVHVLSIDEDVALQITLPDGTWSQSSVPLGTAIPVMYDEKFYGIKPVDIDKRKNSVKVQVVTARSDISSFDSAIAISPAHETAVIQHINSEARLVIVPAYNSSGISSLPLGTIDQVLSLDYDTPTNLMLRTRDAFKAVRIGYNRNKGSRLMVEGIQNLPNILSLQLPSGVAAASVESWLCE